MNIKQNLTTYINDVNFIQKELQIDSDLSKLKEIFDYIENYFEQIQSIKSPLSTIFTEEPLENNLSTLDRQELKNKLLFKLNKLLNEKIELVDFILNEIEMRLNSMTSQHETITNKVTSEMSGEQLSLLNSIEKINKIFWLNFYKLKSELKFESSSINCKVPKLLIQKWIKEDIYRLQVELEICRHYIISPL